MAGSGLRRSAQESVTSGEMIAEKDFAGRQLRGARALQEDAYAFSEIGGTDQHQKGILLVVADGLGGHTAGEQASETALKNFIAAFHDAGGKIDNRLEAALRAANQAIAREVERNPGCEGMATTLLALTVTRAGVEWISVGDSPLFLFHSGQLNQINEDHSLRPVLTEMAEHGEISAEQSKSKHILRAALTGDEISLVDLSKEPIPLAEGDLVLAATDGIRSLKESGTEKICGQLANADASDLAAAILEAVRDANNPRQDNTTIAIIKAPVS